MRGIYKVTSVVGVPDGKSAIKRMEKHKYDLVVLDIMRLGMNGIEVLEIIKRRLPETPVLMLTIIIAKSYVFAAFDLGASGYLSKQYIFKHFQEAITLISRGKKYISGEVAELLAKRDVLED
jgi:DNA-binding NarL/FixJ family response regulator